MAIMLDKVRSSVAGLANKVATKAAEVNDKVAKNAKSQEEAQYIIGLDIGTEFVKALIGKLGGDKIEVVGKEEVDGATAWKVAITHEDKTTVMYLDEKTALERKVSAPVNQGGTELLFESIISDYQAVDGIMVPRQVQTRVGGQTQATVNIDSVEFNVPIDDAEFKMPTSKQ